MNATQVMTVEQGTAAKPNSPRMERFNIVLPREDSEWLDVLAWQIRAQTGAKVSRSEIVRAAIAGLRELHLRAPERPSKFVPLAQARSGSDLELIAILAARLATTEAA